jgi:hypothetical protein
VSILASRQRESFWCPFTHVEDELGMPPSFVLAAVDVERTATHVAQEDVSVTDYEFTLHEAHRKAAVTTPT